MPIIPCIVQSFYSFPEVPYMARLNFDTRIEIHERNVLTMLDVIGTIGGLFELVELALILVMGYLVSKLFGYSVHKNTEVNMEEKRLGAQESEPVQGEDR